MCQQQHVTDALSGEGRGSTFLPLCQQQQIQSISRSVGRSVGQSQPRSQGLSLVGRSVNKASGLTDLARPRDVAVDFRVNVVQ